MTPLEGQSLFKGALLLLTLAALRLSVVSLTGRGPLAVEGESDLERLMQESVEAKTEADRRTAPLAAGETVDPNRSGEEELDRLPGVGPATARALVTSRRERGGFWSPEDLLEVRGIGPATLEKIRPYLDFSGGLPLDLKAQADPGSEGGSASSDLRRSLQAGGATKPGYSPSRVDLNRAGVKELETLPGIGPALAERIVEDRRKAGLFLKPEDLLRVRGIGPATLERIRDLILPRG